MRTLIFILIATCSSYNGFSQNAAFTNALLDNSNNDATIVFTVAREVNIRHYRLEASNDSVNFEVVTTIPAKGNSMLPVNYSVVLPSDSYTYYRIGKVGMDATIPYSAVLMNKAPMPQQENEPIDSPTTIANDMLTIR